MVQHAPNLSLLGDWPATTQDEAGAYLMQRLNDFGKSRASGRVYGGAAQDRLSTERRRQDHACRRHEERGRKATVRSSKAKHGIKN